MHHEHDNPPLGRLEVICGPMFTGKSTELIARLRAAAREAQRATVHGNAAADVAPSHVEGSGGVHGSGRTGTGAGSSGVIAVKPAIDTRYDARAIATHDGDRLAAATIGIDEPGALLGFGARVLGLDEAHFFTRGLHEAVMTLLGRGTRVILAGLDRTSMNQPFGEMSRLLVEADEVVKKPGVCAVCGRPAVHTIRLFDSTEDIVVGGQGMFENRCRLHLAR